MIGTSNGDQYETEYEYVKANTEKNLSQDPVKGPTHSTYPDWPPPDYDTEKPAPIADPSTQVASLGGGLGIEDAPSSGVLPAKEPAPSSELPVVAKSEPTKTKPFNYSDEHLLSMKVDDIPEGMSAREFIQKLQSKK